MKKRVTFATVVVLTLILLCATAFGLSRALEGWLGTVGQMETQGVFQTWGLSEKTLFVKAMHDNALDMDETLYQQAMDETLGADEREAACDQLIDQRYGDLIREQISAWVQPPDTAVGLAPDPVILFKEAYYAEYPTATDQEYLDALGRWQRELSAMYPEIEPLPAPTVDDSYARQGVESYMTEVLSWPYEAAQQAKIEANYVESYQAWECTGWVLKVSLEGAFEPVLEGDMITDTGDGLQLRLTIDKNGRAWPGMTAAEADKAWRSEPVWNITYDECVEVARKGLVERYGLTQQKAQDYFVMSGDVNTDADNNALVGVMFKTHNNYASTDVEYFFIVNAGTGEVVDSFTPQETWDRLPQLAAAYPHLSYERKLSYMRYYYSTYNPFGGFVQWTVEQKALFSSLFKDIVDAEQAKNPDQQDPAYDMTRRRYGVPGEGDIPQAQALELAKRAGEKALGLKQGALDAWRGQLMSFSIDEPLHPVWRFRLYNTSEPYGLCIVSLDGKTGEVLFAGEPDYSDATLTVYDTI